MGIRLIHTAGNNAGKMARAFRDSEWQEYRVKFYRNGVYEGRESDYHTDNKEDAVSTAEHFVRSENPGEYSVHVDMGEHVHEGGRNSNPEVGPSGGLIDTQEEISKFVKRMDRETLYASAAYGRRPRITDWEKGLDFKAHNPRWVGGPYFSIRDADRIYAEGYRRIVVGGGEGFDVDLVME